MYVLTVVSIILYFQIFDRLQPLGVCLSYYGGIQLLDKFAGHFNAEVIDSLKAGKRIRIVGDNINWKTNVHDERQDHHGKMHHAFGSAVIVQNTTFHHLCDVRPQQLIRNIDTHVFLPSKMEWDNIQKDFAVDMSKVAAKHIPFFAQFLSVLPHKQWNESAVDQPDGFSEKNKVIPLPVLHLNEQKYNEVVQIMDFYEEFLSKCHKEAGLDFQDKRILIGGDQLTRERFSGAKRLRTCGLTPQERLQHLSPITFELFHLLMNYVKLFFKQLYNDNSTAELGTMKCEATRIMRTSVNENVNEHYDSDKDFIVSYVDAYIVEAVLDHFGMMDVNSVPTRNQPPTTWTSNKKKQDWIMTEFGRIVQSYVWAKESKTIEHSDVQGMYF